MKSVLNKKVSYFRTCRHKHGVDVDLLTLLRSDKLHEYQLKQITLLRGSTDPDERRAIKEALSCYTVAGIFDPCTEAGRKELSGLACFDFDGAEGHDILYLLTKLRAIRHIAYAGLSCSGTRLFGIVPFLYPEKYLQHYDSFMKTFEQLIGIPLGDPCHKSLCQVRWISLNTPETEFFNHTAEPYGLLEEKKHYLLARSHPPQTTNDPIDWDKAFDWVVSMKQKDGGYTDGNRHHFIGKVVFYANKKGIPKGYALSGALRHFTCERKSQKEIESIVDSIYRKHQDKHNSIPYKLLT